MWRICTRDEASLFSRRHCWFPKTGIQPSPAENILAAKRSTWCLEHQVLFSMPDFSCRRLNFRQLKSTMSFWKKACLTMSADPSHSFRMMSYHPLSLSTVARMGLTRIKRVMFYHPKLHTAKSAFAHRPAAVRESAFLMEFLFFRHSKSVCPFFRHTPLRFHVT